MEEKMAPFYNIEMESVFLRWVSCFFFTFISVRFQLSQLHNLLQLVLLLPGQEVRTIDKVLLDW
jgi:hypothetical protein